MFSFQSELLSMKISRWTERSEDIALLLATERKHGKERAIDQKNNDSDE